jgi:hypothetical protein
MSDEAAFEFVRLRFWQGLPKDSNHMCCYAMSVGK